MNHIYQQLIHFLFSKKKIASYNDFFNQKVIKFVLIHCSWIILFALIYYIIDIWIAMHHELAKKYFIPKWVLESKSEKTKKVVDEEINRSKPFFYHLYFSALTQTTVGYAGQVNSDGITIPILMKDYIFQMANFLQLVTIFTTPVIALFWHPDSGEFLFWKNKKKKLK